MLSKARAQLAVLRQILQLLWSESAGVVRRHLLLALVLLLAMSLTTALGPVALKLLVDSLAANRAESSLLTLVALYVLSQWFARSVGELRGLVYAKAERRMFRTLSQRLFTHVMRLPLRFHLERQTGAISQVLQNGLVGYQLIAHHLVFTLLPLVVEFGTIIAVLLALGQPVFLLFFLLALLCYGSVFIVVALRISSAASGASSAQVNATAAIVDGVLNYEAVKLFAAEAAVQERIRRELQSAEREWLVFYRRYTSGGLMVAAVFAAFLLVSVSYAALQARAGALTLGDFVLVNTYMLQIVRPIELLGLAVQALSQGMAMLEKMLDLLNEKPEKLQPSTAPAVDGPGELRFDSVSVAYRRGRPVVRNVSFLAPAGHVLGIVGASGGGKSTIVRLLVRMLEADQGRILLDGVPIDELPLEAVRRAIAVVPQDTVLFDDTIAYNIALGRPGSTTAEIEAAAKAARLHDFIVALPEGYQTRVGERGVKLSGGERQRVAIARAALKQPRIYVFDEATSSLDTRSEREIMRNFLELSGNRTTLVIAHRLSTVVHADEILVLQQGQIVERGTHDELRSRGGHYAALWNAQHGGERERERGLASFRST